MTQVKSIKGALSCQVREETERTTALWRARAPKRPSAHRKVNGPGVHCGSVPPLFGGAAGFVHGAEVRVVVAERPRSNHALVRGGGERQGLREGVSEGERKPHVLR